ncbi:hypothetical protein CVD25_10685 [Bacillus canaveralius]|uniref:Uncharacterized protein n=1 Tax=Bacillus canaveralius TaxID=1403243 RepID=A0A2N5GM48_9BACI|nr:MULTISPECIES: hypothetical protein [Bacillus]PLR82905.1 hypothetical protein CU635_10510 [Bacillus canaveralius]PLR85275.1 hypothetical protein CVD23_10020 [Bacillus sp. V33-4]PLR97090.1 hypothetical protein CVD25_10685 [Bacillus canaveralius]RSK55510.1 hypothetical protein EJA13_03485 [Bacillus canaveralius]
MNKNSVNATNMEYLNNGQTLTRESDESFYFENQLEGIEDIEDVDASDIAYIFAGCSLIGSIIYLLSYIL